MLWTWGEGGESFFLLLWTCKCKVKAEPELCTTSVLGRDHCWYYPAAFCQHRANPLVLWSKQRPGEDRQWATCNLPLTLEISQKQAEQSHVLRGTTGTILSEQRYAGAEVLASLYSVPHGREENYERVYPI